MQATSSTHPHIQALRRYAAVLCSLLLVATAARAAAPDAPVLPDKAHFHLFVLMGQSNMADSGQPVLPEYITPDSHVLILGRDLKWAPAKVSFGGGMGPGRAFARQYATLHPGVTVGLILGARGGRSLKELGKGGKDRDGAPNYDNTLSLTREAMKIATLKGVLWHQGESDCGDPDYVEKLKTLVNDLRTDTESPALPFIAGELGRYASWTARFNTLIPTARTTIPHCGVAGSEGLLDLGDKVHFSGFSCEILGARYLLEYLTMQEPALVPAFKPTLAAITKAMQAQDAAWETVLNPSMTEGQIRPLGWDGAWMSQGKIQAMRDDKDFASAPASLRVESVGGAATGSVSTPLRNVCGKRLSISCKMKNAGFSSVHLSLTGIDGSWTQILNQNVIDAHDAKEWTTLTAEFVVPAQAVNTRLAILVSGDGKAWLDDVVIEKTTPAPGSNMALNSEMTEGQDTPTGWTSVWASSGKLTVNRDTQIFKSGPASLRLDSDGGPVNGSASQSLKDVAGKTITIKGWAKCQGPKSCSVGIGTFDGAWKMLKWINVFNQDGQAGFDWTAFEQTVAIPAEAVTVNLALGLNGEGSVWFDDVTVTEVK